jgi:hypothetical protein
MGEATWGTILFLLENHHLAASSRPERFGPELGPPPFGQFPEWRAIYDTAMQSGLDQPGQRVEGLVLRISHMLVEHYGAGQIRRLPLNCVLAFLRHRVGLEATAADRSRGSDSVEPWMPAEARLENYLATCTVSTLEEAARSTGISRHKLQKMKAWQDHEETKLGDFLRDNPNAQLSDVRGRFGWSHAKISGKKPWQAHTDQKTSRKTLTEGRQLSDAYLRSCPDTTAIEPGRTLEARDELWGGLLNAAPEVTKTKLTHLADADRDLLLEYLVESLDGEQLGGENRQRLWQVAIAAAESWLDEDEQRRRRRNRPY